MPPGRGEVIAVAPTQHIVANLPALGVEMRAADVNCCVFLVCIMQFEEEDRADFAWIELIVDCVDDAWLGIA